MARQVAGLRVSSGSDRYRRSRHHRR
jgi:hypothetical protein